MPPGCPGSRPVLLLEAGPGNTFPTTSSTATTSPGPFARRPFGQQPPQLAFSVAPIMSVPRGKVTGGSSAINMSAFFRGIPEDFDAWASLGNDEWNFERVLPYFRRIETDVDRHGDDHGRKALFSFTTPRKRTGVPQWAFFNACLSNGFAETDDHNSPSSHGVGPSITNNHNRVRFSTSLGYLSQGRHRLNLTIRANCHVHRVLFEGNRATGVEVESGGETFVVEGNNIILSAGAVGSPQLLMLSGVGPARHLAELGIPVVRDLPGVGQNLKDHPKLYVTWRVKEDHPVEAVPARGGANLRFTAPGSHLRNDLSINMGAFVTRRVKASELPFPADISDDLSDRRVEMMTGLLLPVSSGELRLTSTDPTVQPFLDYNYLDDPFDRERLRAGVRMCLQLAESNELKDIIGERIEPTDADLESDDALDRWMLREAHTYSHISGTCKMGPSSDPMAVVDQYGKVYGLEGLRVADASIMPDLVRAAINPTVLMMGERLADFVLEGR